MKKQVDLASLYEHAACGLITFKIKGTILFANKTLLNWLGCTLSDLTDKTFTDLLTRGGQLYFNLFIQPLLQVNAEVKEINFEITGAAGNFPVLFSAGNINFKKGADNIVHGVIFKIHERKMYESELLKERKKVDERLMLQSQVLDEVAYNQSHVIRAPLASILGLINLLEENSELSDENRTIIKLLKISAVNLDAVINNIVDLTAKSTG